MAVVAKLRVLGELRHQLPSQIVCALSTAMPLAVDADLAKDSILLLGRAMLPDDEAVVGDGLVRRLVEVVVVHAVPDRRLGPL